MANGTNEFVMPFNVHSLAFPLAPLVVVAHCGGPSKLSPQKGPADIMLDSWSLTLQTTQEGEVVVLHIRVRN